MQQSAHNADLNRACFNPLDAEETMEQHSYKPKSHNKTIPLPPPKKSSSRVCKKKKITYNYTYSFKSRFPRVAKKIHPRTGERNRNRKTGDTYLVFQRDRELGDGLNGHLL